MNGETLLFSAADVDRHLDLRRLIDEVRAAMRGYASPSRTPAQRAHSAVPSGSPHSVMMVFPGLIPGVPAYTVKFNAKLPNGSPSVRGLIALLDLQSGAVLAVMDSIRITAARTAAVGAVAADALARRDAATVAVIGAGVQGFEQVRALRHVRAIRDVRAFDILPDRAAALAVKLPATVGVACTAARSVEEAVSGADIVVSATWASEPFLDSSMVAAGTHITAVGADEPGKAEVTADLIRASTFVCDDDRLAVEMGALAGVGLGADVIHATLGQVLTGERSGRTEDSEITVFGSVGLACQDLAAAWMVYDAARHSPATTFRFHAS